MNHSYDNDVFFGQFGYTPEEINSWTEEQINALDLAIDSAGLEHDLNPEKSEFDICAAYIGGCIENNFNK